MRAKAKRAPDDRHRSLISELYVEPICEGSWNRPASISAGRVHEFLQDAVNDYSVQYHQRYIIGEQPTLADVDCELYTALEKWPDRPALHPPEWQPLVAV